MSNIRDAVNASMARAERWGMDTAGLATFIEDDGLRNDMADWSDEDWTEHFGEEEGLPTQMSLMDQNLQRLKNYK